LSLHYGIQGKANDLLRSYLTNRTFSVFIGGVQGKKLILKFGVPQGSLLGPLLFILYCKEIEKIAFKYGLQVHLYADDSQFYVEINANNLSSVKINIELCLHEIHQWMSANFLKLNQSKTDLVVFNPSRRPFNVPLSNPSFEILFDDCIIESSPSTTILGIDLSSNIDLKSFIVSKCQSCNFHLRNLKHVKNCLNVKVRTMLVNNLILSKLDYGNAVLAACTVADLNALQVVMNNAVRFILDVGKRAHITPHLKKLHFLPVKQRILYKLCLIAFKVINKTAPLYLNDIFCCYEPTTTMSLRQSTETDRDTHLLTYAHSNELSNKCIFKRLTSSWNSLPFTLRTVSDVNTFKKDLKTFFFKQAFES